MAGIAKITTVDMTSALARCRRTIMALDTIIDKVSVINPGRQPAKRGMANITLAVSLNMVSGFASGDNAVMTC